MAQEREFATPEPVASVAPALLTIAEAARYLNVPPTWVAEAARQHRLRCIKLGRKVRFKIEHLDELIQESEQALDVTPPDATRLLLSPPAPRRSGRARL